MDSTVKSRPNHYEILGLKIGASSDEIQRAFMREICVDRPRAFGGVALLSIAYETLRDPAKRRAYDESIGVAAKPTSKVESKTASFIAASLRRPGQAPVAPRVVPAATPRILPPAPPAIEPAAAQPPASVPERLPEAQAKSLPELPASLRQPIRPPIEHHLDEVDALAIGGVLLAVGLVGAWAGVEAGSEAEQAKPAVSMRLPAAKPVPAITGSSPAPPPLIEPVQHERSARTVIAAAPSGAAHPPAAPDGLQLQRAVSALADNEPEAAATTEAAVEVPAAAEATAAEAVSASMPLPDSVIARTIGRIGYACGSVASVEGAGSGVFKVTCTSGDSYRASPVRGRYHFKRLSGG